MSSSIDFLFSTRGLVWVLVFFAVWLRLRPASRAAPRWLAVAALLYLAASIYAVPFAISRTLVSGYHRFAAAEGQGAGAIVLLGAGGATVGDDGRYLGLLSTTAAARILEAARVYNLIGPVWIISSGGVPQSSHYVEPSSETMRRALVQLGIPESKIVLQSASFTTRDDAVLVAQVLRPLGVTRVVLVTSDLHMRRSLGAFRAAGISAVPAIAPDTFGASSFVRWALPTEGGFRLSQSLIHECLGLAYYGVRGWWR